MFYAPVMNSLLARRNSCKNSRILSICAAIARTGVQSEPRRCLSDLGRVPHPVTQDLDSSIDSVRCDNCKGFYHMACVQPPLLAKPSRGYGWSCASCARRHEADVEAHDVRHDTPPVRGKGTNRVQKAKKPALNSLTDDRESDDKYFKMWPFRYFG